VFYTKSFSERLLELALKELVSVRDNFSGYSVLACHHSVEKEYEVFRYHTFFVWNKVRILSKSVYDHKDTIILLLRSRHFRFR